MNEGEGKRTLAVLLYESRSQFRFWGTGRLSIDPHKTIHLNGKNPPPKEASTSVRASILLVFQ